MMALIYKLRHISTVVNQISVVLMSLTQLLGTMHNICKVQGSIPDHQKKKKQISVLSRQFESFWCLVWLVFLACIGLFSLVFEWLLLPLGTG